MALPWFAAGWLTGIAGACQLVFPTWQWLTLSAISLAGAIAVRRERRLARGFLVLAFVFLGAARSQMAIEHRASASVARSTVPSGVLDLVGMVSSRGSLRGETKAFDVRARQILAVEASEDQPVDGTVLVLIEPGATVRRGETVQARGHLRVPYGPERAGYSAVFEATSVRTLAAPDRASATTLLDNVRATLVDRLFAVLPAGEASLVAGVLLGADEQMPQPVRSAFRLTGTAHILAVSGFNVTVVAAASMAAFGALFGARRGAAAAGTAILLYTLLAGAEAPVVRAALMAGFVLMAARLGRQSTALASLAAATILMTLWDPSTLGDVGFQLSFLATLGLVIAGRPLQAAWQHWAEGAIGNDGLRAAVMLIGEVVLITTVAQVATLPLSAYTFHQVPLTSLIANAFILPAQPPLMATGALTALAALIHPSLGRALAWIAWPFAAYTIRMAGLFAGLPGASPRLATFPAIDLVLIYAGLAAIVLAARVPRWRAAAGRVVRLGGPAWVVLLAALATLAWKAAAERPDGRLHVTALAGGDVVIETPGGRFVAVSRAPGQIGLAEELDRHLPVTHPTLDWLVLLQAESDPAVALRDLGRHAPPGVLALETAGFEDPTLSGAELVRASVGSTLDLGGGARLEMQPAGRSGFVALITTGRARILLIDGADAAVVASLGRRIPRPTAVVLLGEARPMARILESDWRGMNPLVIIACPLPGEAWPALRPVVGRPTILATPTHGWVEVLTDGRRLDVRSERNP